LISCDFWLIFVASNIPKLRQDAQEQIERTMLQLRHDIWRRRLSAGILQVVIVCLVALFAATPSVSADETYPARPVRIIVGFGAGASADIAARIIARQMGQILGQQFVIENRPGGGSNIATEYVARAPKDGYTLLCGTVANTINTTLSTNLTFDFAKDFAPIALTVTLPNILVVHPSLGVDSVIALSNLARAKPDQIFFGSSGVGTSPHLSGELFNQMVGIKLVHVPYPGSAQAVTDLLAGRVQVMFSPASTVLPQVAAGKLKALASTELRRTSAAPDLPTMDESGISGFDTSVWFGLLAPAGTPPQVIATLNRAVNEALASEDVQARLRVQGMDPLGGTPQDFAHTIASETGKWARVISRAGLGN
jgi:tripartite-type tricarboxylate transporter receptor subunit TctC